MIAHARLALIWERFGEYHHARLARAGAHMALHGIEIAAKDRTYDWAAAEARGGYDVTTLAPDTDLPAPEIHDRLDQALTRIDPDVVALPGWSAPYALSAMDWTRRRGRSAVLMSDSNRFDAPRKHLPERLKAAVVAHAGAGFAAGSTARAYLSDLGLSQDRITLGYDVVDNAHFAAPADLPPRRGFIAIARFIERKNLDRLLSAYAAYRDLVPDPWDLTLVGDGPKAEALKARSAALGLSAHVHFPGFLQHDAIPGALHRAGAFILPSLVEQWGLVVNEAMAAGLPVIISDRAGAAHDLVVEGETGFILSPTDTEAMSQAMARLSQDPARAARMGAAGAIRIADWGLERFADGLTEAARISLEQRPAPSLMDRGLFALLLRKALR